MAIIANCVVCGSSFERCGKGSNRVRTCSKACSAEHKRTRERAYAASYLQRPEVLEKSASRKRLPTADEVRAVLDYDPESGILTWLARQGDDRATKAWNAKHANKQAGSLNKKGYLQVRLFGRNYQAHRVIWLLVTGRWPSGFDIDHSDTVRSNNRLDNLRLATNSQNRANSKKPSNNTSGFKGVHFSKVVDRYVASISVNGRTHHLGCYGTPEAAHAAYLNAAEWHFGPFARAA
jgi:hypothetical protein